VCVPREARPCLARELKPFATPPEVVSQQAAAIASAWSPSGAPPSWRLTAAQFEVLRDDRGLQELAATIPPDRLPPLLFEAAATSLVLELEPAPLRAAFPVVGDPQPPLPSSFHRLYREFCLDHGDRLLERCARHRYQMNEVGRCADLLPALAPAIAEDREIALVDIGTGAGLALHLDRYRYVFSGPDDQRTAVGNDDSEVVLETRLRGEAEPPIPARLPQIASRVGIDVEPLEITEPSVRAWLAACIPQEISAVTRFHRAAELAIANPARTIRGDATEILTSVLALVPDDQLPCLIDSYVHVFFEPDQLARFRRLVDELGAERDLDWISVDPLVPLGGSADRSVLGLPVDHALVDRNRHEGLFGVIGRLRYRGGQRTGAILGIAHPGAAWLEWLAT
jgi:hypothetical protein